MASESTTPEALLSRVESLGWAEIGRSTLGRPIRAGLLPGVAPRAGPPARPLLVMAGIHGNEPSSVEAVLELIETAARRPLDPPPGGPAWVVPALNPDGLASGLKNAARDVDLNRNFPARNFTRTHPPGYDPGPAPLSEPETQALASLLEETAPWGVLAVHAPFACLNYDGPAAAWAQTAAAASGWPVQADIGYPTPGSLGSWLGVDRRLPVLTLELPAGPFAAFRGPALRALLAALAWSTAE